MEVTGRGHGHGGAGQRAAARSADSAPSASSYPGATGLQRPPARCFLPGVTRREACCP